MNDILPTRRCDPTLFQRDLTGQVVIVTGANTGIGLKTARRLSQQHATVVLACRSVQKGQAAADDDDVGGIFLAPMDLASLRSVREFCEIFRSTCDRLDILVNNAGIMNAPYSLTDDGFEIAMGCNHLGHFLLSQLLAPLMIRTAEKTGKPSRLVIVSSAHAGETSVGRANIDLEDLHWKQREYHAKRAYASSKLANYLHALHASQIYPPDKLICVSLHPGWVQTQLTKGVGDISTVDGAQTSLHCCLSDDVQSGEFYSQKGAYVHDDDKPGGWPMVLRNPNATPELAVKLWEISERLVGLK
jgi:NAD(P)-dependent dehydrogenase (short-subunit alcohol dehydrogenase family)